MGLFIYDLVLLAVFLLGISLFLYSNRKNLKRQGLLILYRTKWGIKLINSVGRKYDKQLRVLGILSIFTGYILMICSIYLIGKIVWLYVLYPGIVKQIKVPPIMPLIPYLPKMFKLNFLPPFYFTYWVIILAIVAISHEFAHGVFAAHNKIKIKKTGFGFFPFFFPIFPLAFVELDEKNLEKKKIRKQMEVLSAGTFANIIIAIISSILMIGFFNLAFYPAGITFNDYSYSVVELGTITSINSIPIENVTYKALSEFIRGNNFTGIQINGKKYVAAKAFFQEDGKQYLVLYDDAPAIRENLTGAITSINGNPIKSWEQLGEELRKYKPGDTIKITTEKDEGTFEYTLQLGKDPRNESRAYLGIGYHEYYHSNFLGKLLSKISSFKKQNIYYKSKIKGGWFIYNLFWWMVLIGFSVALVNMLPVGIFDGGRFFYLTILYLTKSKRKAEKTFRYVTILFLLILLLLMVSWVIGIK